MILLKFNTTNYITYIISIIKYFIKKVIFKWSFKFFKFIYKKYLFYNYDRFINLIHSIKCSIFFFNLQNIEIDRKDKLQNILIALPFLSNLYICITR